MTNGDWNALAIRLSASLYRLRGILHYQQQNQHGDYYDTKTNKGRNGHSNGTVNNNGNNGNGNNSFYDSMNHQEMIKEAREASQIYVSLSQRSGGMMKLKAELENTAFHLLYK